MAARKNKLHPDPAWVERIRSSIKSSMLIKSLHEHVEGARQMEASQVTAALGLLKKVLPDLAATDTSVTVEQRRYVLRSSEVMTRDAWDEQHAKQPTSH